MAYLPGLEKKREKITPGTAIVEDKLIDAQKVVSDEAKENMTTGTRGVPTQVYEVPVLDIN